MGSKLSTLPVVSALAQAYFVAGDAGLKQTTEMAFEGVTLKAEEIAAFLPVPEAVIDDSAIDLWAECRPGSPKRSDRRSTPPFLRAPTSPPAGRPRSCPGPPRQATSPRRALRPSQRAASGDIDAALDAVEADGFDATGIASKRALRGLLRRARDANGQRLADLDAGTVEGVPVSYVGGGVFDAATLAVAGDFTMAVLGLRQDMTFKLLDQAVITDDTGKVIYNLPQQDMAALRVVFRAGFAIANPVTRRDDTTSTPYPFAVLAADTTP